MISPVTCRGLYILLHSSIPCYRTIFTGIAILLWRRMEMMSCIYSLEQNWCQRLGLEEGDVIIHYPTNASLMVALFLLPSKELYPLLLHPQILRLFGTAVA